MSKSKLKIKDIVLIGIFSAIIVISSWIQVPFAIPFTLQTLGINLTIFVLGPYKGLFSIITYLLLGLIGVPVFSSFGGGVGQFVGPTAGFIYGFILLPLIYIPFHHLKVKIIGKIVYFVLSTLMLYLCGTLWFSFVYTNQYNFAQGLMTCVVPYIAPDIIKGALAIILSYKLQKVIYKN